MLRIQLLSFLLFIVACKTSQKAIVETKPPVIVNKDMLLSSLQSELPFEFLSFKGNAYIQHPDYDGSVQVILNWQIDNGILLVVRKFGFEISRIFIQKDSVKMLDRINQLWDIGSTQQWAEKYGISGGFNCLQSVLLRGAYCPAEMDFRKLETEEKLHRLEAEKGKLLWVSDFNQELEPLNTALSYEAMKVDIQILSYQTIKEHKLPSSWNLQYKDSTDFLELQMKWSEIIPAENLNLKFDIPSHYTRDKLL
ncbi:MAG: DUF4292 domain-containing protein [Saprospiraceae bacterium]|nr:DUF4292 domain-containing protein [Saprospiraceae bacterium]MBK7810878.1 DUF4292 domain-containing protein [Saprospiraceae bacterium]